MELVPIESPQECHDLAVTLARVWGVAEPGGVIAPDALRAMAHSGCYVTGVVEDGALIGGGFGWPTHTAGEWRLHSHVVGFLDGHRKRGLGAQVKHHQRAWVAERGWQAVEWTYDPLVVANAHFNLAKLGARIESFHRDFYGSIDDEFSAGLPSDRFLVRWAVDDAPPADVETDGHAPMLSVGTDGAPVVHHVDGDRFSAQVPTDMISIRRRDPGLALTWTDAFACTVGAAVNEGATVRSITADGVYLIGR